MNQTHRGRPPEGRRTSSGRPRCVCFPWRSLYALRVWVCLFQGSCIHSVITVVVHLLSPPPPGSLRTVYGTGGTGGGGKVNNHSKGYLFCLGLWAKSVKLYAKTCHVIGNQLTEECCYDNWVHASSQFRINDLFPRKFQLTLPPPKKKVSVFWKILTGIFVETLCNDFCIKVLYSFYSVEFSLAGSIFLVEKKQNMSQLGVK